MHIILADHTAQQLGNWFEKLTVCVDHAQHSVDCFKRDQSGVASMIALQVKSMIADGLVEPVMIDQLADITGRICIDYPQPGSYREVCSSQTN